ncbi:MAG TPA: hypothetical protein VIC26_16235 [Marinagarivorans sp.]
MQQYSSDRALLSAAMRNNFQLGVFSRASRLFMQCDDFNHFFHYVTDTLEELGLSGRVKLTCGNETRQASFGSGICPAVYDSLNSLERCQSKIYSGLKFSIFNTEHVLLILDSEHTGDMDMDLLIDNITIYMDTIHYWLEQQQKICIEREEVQQERARVISNLHSFIECVTRLNQHLTETQQAVNEDLLSQLIGIFPVMGMEADQEEAILNIVHNARSKEQALVSQQLKQNEDLRVVIKQAIAALVASTSSHKSHQALYPESAAVTLF